MYMGLFDMRHGGALPLARVAPRPPPPMPEPPKNVHDECFTRPKCEELELCNVRKC